MLVVFGYYWSIGIIGMKIFLGQNSLLVPFCYDWSIGIIGMKIFVVQNLLLVPSCYDSKKIRKSILDVVYKYS